MAKDLFPMYCGLYGIEGMEEELETCNEILELGEPGESCIALININDGDEWVYGQCTFKHEDDHVANFKFSNTFENLQDQGVIPVLAENNAVSSIFVLGSELKHRFATHHASSDLQDLFVLVDKQSNGFVAIE